MSRTINHSTSVTWLEDYHRLRIKSVIHSLALGEKKMAVLRTLSPEVRNLHKAKYCTLKISSGGNYPNFVFFPEYLHFLIIQVLLHT